MTPGVPLTFLPTGSHVRRHRPGDLRGSVCCEDQYHPRTVPTGETNIGLFNWIRPVGQRYCTFCGVDLPRDYPLDLTAATRYRKDQTR